MEKFLKYVMYGIWFLLLIFGFWFSITFTVMLLKEVNGFFMSLLVIFTEICCLGAVINILKRMWKDFDMDNLAAAPSETPIYTALYEYQAILLSPQKIEKIFEKA